MRFFVSDPFVDLEEFSLRFPKRKVLCSEVPVVSQIYKEITRS